MNLIFMRSHAGAEERGNSVDCRESTPHSLPHSSGTLRHKVSLLWLET